MVSRYSGVMAMLLIISTIYGAAAESEICPAGEFTCANGECIDEGWVCDSERDCEDGEDEANCTLSCEGNEFNCGEKCIIISWVCDKEEDCLDGSDEVECPYEVPTDPTASFPAASPTPPVEDPTSEICDNENQFTCQERCIPISWVCDSDYDCANGDDERNCESQTLPPDHTNPDFQLYGSEGLRLLIWRGKTVCDDNFNALAAVAICREMGFNLSASFYATRSSDNYDGLELDIGLDDVSCESNSWGDCDYTESHNCGHSEDIFLSCVPRDARFADLGEGFVLINEEGKLDSSSEELGLLLFNSSTVCNDGFSEFSALVACKEMGYARSLMHTTNESTAWMHTGIDFRLVEMRCNGKRYERDSYTIGDCSYFHYGNAYCQYGADIYLSCTHDPEPTTQPIPSTATSAPTTPIGCLENEFRCKDRCITANWRCDGHDDCPDGEDELGCVNEKCPTGYTYLTGSTWDNSLDYSTVDTQSECENKCSSNEDCKSFEHSDNESGCSTYGFLKPTSEAYDDYVWCSKIEISTEGTPSSTVKMESTSPSDGACQSDEFRCPEKCIYHEWRCDGEEDCEGAFDEIDCELPSSTTAQFTSTAATEPFDVDQARFALVDGNGSRNVSEGLLLFGEGTVCGENEDSFSMNSANAICQSLGFLKAYRWWRAFDERSTQRYLKVRLVGVNCSDTNIDSCLFDVANERHTSCRHNDDVHLKCTNSDEPVLEFSLIDQSGEVITEPDQLGLLLYFGGTVCGNGFNDHAADVICKELGFAEGRERFMDEEHVWNVKESLDIRLSNVNCDNQTRWHMCYWVDRDIYCGHFEDVFLSCSDGRVDEVTFNLLDEHGEMINEGAENRRYLLTFNGGTVCDDGFDEDAGNAICRLMGYDGQSGFSSSTSSPYQYEYANGMDIKLDDLDCMGGNWSDCTYNTVHNCGHSEDVYLSCHYADSPTAGFKLVTEYGENMPQSSEQTGLLIFNGGTVCDDLFGTIIADIICRELGYQRSTSYTSGYLYEIQDTLPINVDDIECPGTEWSDCEWSTGSQIDCGHSEDVHLTCTHQPEEVGEVFQLVDEYGLPVVYGGVDVRGLLLYKGGTVCDDGFSSYSADVICKMLGFTHSSEWTSARLYQDLQESLQINLDDFMCLSESFSDCTYTEDPNCGHHEDIFLTCSSFETIQTEETTEYVVPTTPQPATQRPSPFMLIDPDGNQITSSDTALLLFQGGTVCDDYFNDNAALAICLDMGFRGAGAWGNNEYTSYQQTSLSVTLDDVSCLSNVWAECSYVTVDNCSHEEDIFLSCVPDQGEEETAPMFQIVDETGAEVTQGLGLLLYNGGTVCDDSFDINAANAICKELGYEFSVSFESALKWESQTDYDIMLDDVDCQDSVWAYCRWETNHNCGHGEDIWLECVSEDVVVESAGLKLVNEQGSEVLDGNNMQLLLLFNGGTVCDDDFEDFEANIICSEMGYVRASQFQSYDLAYDSSYEDIMSGWQFREDLDITIDDLSCEDGGSFSSCSWVDHNCGHGEDIFLTCTSDAMNNGGFTMIDQYNNPVTSGGSIGLLLYNGGTVCDDGFGNDEATVICKEMGYSGSEDWDSGLSWGNNLNYIISLDDLDCNVDYYTEEHHWTDVCDYNLVNNCGHSEDIFLTCTDHSDDPNAESPFRIVDANGGDFATGFGLLLFNEGTVCDDGFNDMAATAICRSMGYSSFISWRGYNPTLEWGYDYDITLDDTLCDTEDWASCSYTVDHNCAHSEDVYIECARLQGCSFGYAQEDTGLSGEVLRQITTSSLSNPEWMNGRSFDQNIELCKTECIERESCVGLQFSPTFWDHEECFLMDGVETYTRSSWKTIVKDISTCETIDENTSEEPEEPEETDFDENTSEEPEEPEETDFDPRVEECERNSLRCDNYTRCVEEDHICDGNADCLDGQDEFGCHSSDLIFFTSADIRCDDRYNSRTGKCSGNVERQFRLASSDPRGLRLVQKVEEDEIGPVCDDGFTDREATAICRNLAGRRFGKRGPPQTLSVGQRYKATFVECNAQTDRCEYRNYNNASAEEVYECSPTEAAAVYCFDKIMDYDVTVVDTEMSGGLEIREFTIKLQIKYFKEGQLFWLHNDAVLNKLRVYVQKTECDSEEVVPGVSTRVDKSGIYTMSGTIRDFRDTSGRGCTVDLENAKIVIDKTPYAVASFGITPTTDDDSFFTIS